MSASEIESRTLAMQRRRLLVMHVSLGGSPETFRQLWAAKLLREKQMTTPNTGE